MKNNLHGSIIVTYRCNARCNMCDVWRYPTKGSQEIGVETIEKLPEMFFTNVTGGEPFIREDLPEIIGELKRKTGRVVISTNGYFTERIVNLCKEYPDIGIRISVEGVGPVNDRIRGMRDGYDKTQVTLRRLREMGMKDIGFAMTVQDLNYQDVLPLYRMSRSLGYEFATAAVHNSHYFHKWDNLVTEKEGAVSAINDLIWEMLGSARIKDWFRAYFNHGLINYIEGKPRPLPCEMGKDGFFLDPYGDVLACNGMDRKQPLGNLKEGRWEDIWKGKRAREVRESVKSCRKNCWMIGSAAPAIRHHPVKPVLWVVRNKFTALLRGLHTKDTIR